MKFKSILSAAFLSLLLASCAGESSEKTAATADMTSKADSIVYCFGQMRGAEYLRETERDSTLATETAKQEYLRGVRAGLDAVKYGKDAYNKGVFQGIQMALNISQFEEDYQVRLSDKRFMDGLSEALKSDSAVNTAEMQSAFYKLMNEFNKAKEERDKLAAENSLKGAAEALGMKQISGQLWANLPASEGERIKDGDRVKADITITTLTGKDVKSPFPKEMTVGQRMSTNPISEAIRSLASGQTGEFLTSTHALFGARAQQLGLKPADVLKITVTPTVVEQPKEDAPAAGRPPRGRR